MQTSLDHELVRRLASVSDYAGLMSEAERAIEATPSDFVARYLKCVATFFSKNHGAFILAAVEFRKEAERRVAGSESERARQRLIALTGEHLIQLTECVIWEFGQHSFAGDLLAFIGEWAHKNAALAASVGDAALATRTSLQAGRFWCADTTGNTGRTVWISDTPIQLQVEPTNHCNLQCVMCPRTTAMTRPLGHMGIEQWRNILETWSGRERLLVLDEIIGGLAFHQGVKGGLKLFYLGETLMHPEFERMLQIGAEYNCNIGLQTNGVLLARRSIRKRLLDFAPPTISVSLDGFSAETYESVRAGSRWDVVKRGIEDFLKERDERGLTQQIKVALTSILPDNRPETRENAEAFLQTLAGGSLEVGFIGLTTQYPTQFYDGDGDVTSYGWSPMQAIHSERASCKEPIEKMQVLWDGTVTPCCTDVNAEMVLGWAGMGVDAVWRSESVRGIQLAHARHDLTDYPICQKCLGVDAQCRPEPALASA